MAERLCNTSWMMDSQVQQAGEVPNGVFLGEVLGPVLFNLLINELGEGVSVQMNYLSLRSADKKKKREIRCAGKKIRRCLLLEESEQHRMV